MKLPRTLLRVCAGLLLTAVICLALLWMAAPRLAERLIQRKLVRLGAPVEKLHLRSVTPWMLELEPVRLGKDPDAPTLGVVRVTYVPRELLRAKLRTVVLDGLQFVVRRSKSGAWEVAGVDRILTRRAESATVAQSRSFKQIVDLIPERVAVRAVTAIVETENGRSAFQMELNAERRDDKFDLRATLSGEGNKVAFAALLEAQPDRLSCIGKFSSLNIRGLDLGEAPVQITADRKAVRVEAAVKPPGSALAVTLALSANLETRTFTGSATLPPALVAESDPALAPFLPVSLKGALFSGTLGGRVEASWKSGAEPEAAAEATLTGGQFATADGKFDARGLECGLKLESLAPLRSFPSQKLKFALAHAVGTTLTDGKFTFRLDPPDTIFIEHGSFVWCGGKLSCAAARIAGGKPDGMVVLRAEQVDAGQLTGIMKKEFGGHAEGWLTGRVPLIFGKDGVRLGNVHLIGDPEKPGILQLDPDKWPGNQVDTLGVSPTVKKAMKQTLRNMSLTLLRLDALPKTDKSSTRLCLRVAGTPREDADLPPVDLTINLNIEDRQNLLWNLMNRSNQQNTPGTDADAW